MQRKIEDTLPGRPEGADLVKQENFPGGAQTAHYEQHHGEDHEHHVVPLKTYYIIFGLLMVFLLITVLAAEFDFGERVGPNFAWMNIIVALIIAVVKATLIVMYFMHVKFSSRLVALFSVSAYFFVAIMFMLTYADYLTRDWMPVAGK